MENYAVDEYIENEIQDANEEKSTKKHPKFRYFTMVLYPDCIEHKIFMEVADSGEFFGFKMCWILHDKDRDKNGDLLKPHWHLLIKMPYPMHLDRVQKGFENWISNCKGLEGVFVPLSMSLYLTHSDPRSRLAGKYQYDSCNIRGDVTILCKTEKHTLDELCKQLDLWKTIDHNATYHDAILFLTDCGLLDTVREYGYVATRIIDEYCKSKSEMIFDNYQRMKEQDDLKEKHEKSAKILKEMSPYEKWCYQVFLKTEEKYKGVL